MQTGSPEHDNLKRIKVLYHKGGSGGVLWIGVSRPSMHRH